MRLEPVLVTGATGYVGGRLVPRLLYSGHKVRAMGRSLRKLEARTWASNPLVELVEADALNLESLKKACQGCWAAYYLVHSMNPRHKDFARTDRLAALNMVQAAAEARLDRIIYLGGLVPPNQPLSPHLESRLEVGRILQSGKVPTTVLRAAMILGSGSASFEIMRYLVDRLPVMVTPLWVRTEVQPISIRDVLGYLAGCLEHDEVVGQTFDICGPDILTYEELFQIYAEEAGLPRRRIISVPILSPSLSSYWVHLVTPVHSSIARPLAEGLRNTVVCEENRIRALIPQDLMSCRRVIKRILVKRQQQIVETTWMDAGHFIPPEWVQSGDEAYSGGAVITTAYRIRIKAAPEEVWAPLIRIGGDTGWYFADALWRLRGWLDKILGGVSVKRGRRHPSEVVVGDALDFWRVIEVRPNRRLLLLGEMKAPGEAVLDFRLVPLDKNNTELQMMGRFMPKGLWGLIYWYTLLLFHSWIFKGTLQGLAAKVGQPVSGGPEKFKATG
ncbi:MAG: SDR family oxidoreductase [Thermodesulfobacteriota bacterium]